MPKDLKNLTQLRKKIDLLDEQILKLLEKRAQISRDIGKLKLQNNLPVYNPEREIELLESLLGKHHGYLSPEAIRKIFMTIMEESKRIQAEITQSNQTSELEKNENSFKPK